MQCLRGSAISKNINDEDTNSRGVGGWCSAQVLTGEPVDMAPSIQSMTSPSHVSCLRAIHPSPPSPAPGGTVLRPRQLASELSLIYRGLDLPHADYHLDI